MEKQRDDKQNLRPSTVKNFVAVTCGPNGFHAYLVAKKLPINESSLKQYLEQNLKNGNAPKTSTIAHKYVILKAFIRDWGYLPKNLYVSVQTAPMT